MRPKLSKSLPTVVCALALALLAIGRVRVEGARELSAGEQALARGDVREGVLRLRRAAHWYFPGPGPSARAHERLEAVALQAESQGRVEHALLAWRAVRASALATRWLWVPERARLDRANRHISVLMAELPPPPEDQGKERTRLRDEHYALLAEDRAPEPAWVVVLGLGFALWLASALWAARRGFDEADKPRVRALAIAAAGTVFGVALFLLGVARA